MKVRIRELNLSNLQEVDLIVGRYMETVLESTPELNHDPNMAREVLPDFTYSQAKEIIVGHHSDGENRILVATDLNGELMGHSIFKLKTHNEDHRKFGFFFSRYVSPEHRRFGIASALLSSAELWLKQMGASYALAYCHVKNHKIQNLFKKHAYQIEGPKMGRWPFYELKKALLI